MTNGTIKLLGQTHLQEKFACLFIEEIISLSVLNCKKQVVSFPIIYLNYTMLCFFHSKNFKAEKKKLNADVLEFIHISKCVFLRLEAPGPFSVT